ncbi:MAG: hypothetical protein FIA99_05075 [Ruminiclostridium sp.]|nr:hypothetical protein [Ruminiclostridium sp.]
MNRIYCVISHTHWDREWYMSFEKFRIRLVDLVDNLLEVLETYPEYIFHLDAQTIVLEDYLEIRPYRKNALEKYIKEERLLVGPWYVQNDFYLTSGEATIRNLMIGSRIAEEMGKCTWVGYAPDQFGLISQLPQILNGFGIDNCIFGRGYNHIFFEKADIDIIQRIMPSEFIWEGEDGSRVLAVNMLFWYNNAQRLSQNIDKSIKLLELIEKNFKGIAMTPYLLLMNGVDHLEAQEDLLPVIDEINKRLPAQKHIGQCSMNRYVDSVKEFISRNAQEIDLPAYQGELRNGISSHILPGTLSSRIYLKTANTRAQNYLENKLEPIYSFIHMAGIENKYPSDFMKYLWKLLIQNHPHDSICGCSRDEVHSHMEDRYGRISEAAEELLQRGMDFITAHVSRDRFDSGDYLITVFNTIESSRRGVVELELQFPAEEHVESFSIEDISGNRIPYIILSKEEKSRDIFSPINLPGLVEVDSCKVKIYIESIEGLSYKTLAVKPLKNRLQGMPATVGTEKTDMRMENEFIKATINRNGKIDLLFKETGKVYNDILVLEDMEDCGDSYVYRKTPEGRAYTSDKLIPDIRRVSDSGLETAYSLVYNLELPECFDEDSNKRSGKLVNNCVEMTLSLKKGCKWLDVGFRIANASKDHRLRALIKTHINGDCTEASIPFDIVRRDRRKVLEGIGDGTQPNSGFVNIDGEYEGMAVLNEGMYEYEHLAGDEGIIAITLLRANSWISKRDDKSVPASDTWKVPDNQCIRRIELNMALYPHQGKYLDAEAALKAREFQNPLLAYFQPADLRKFVGGRPAVQDSEIKEIFYREDPFAAFKFPRERKFIDIRGKGIILSAVKKAEEDDRLIVRVYNSNNAESQFEMTYCKPITSAHVVNMNEKNISEPIFEGNRIKAITMKPKEILTIAVK